MSKIAGRDVILYAIVQYSPEERLPIACARTCTLTTNVNTAGVSTNGSGIFQEFKALSINWSISSDGLCSFDENMSIATLRGFQFSLTPMMIEFVETSGATSVTYSGSCIITSIETSGSYSDVETYSITLQGTGELVNSGDFRITNVAPDTPMAGETTITFDYASWTGATAYTIRARYLSDGSTDNFTTGAAPQSIVVTSSLIADGVAFSYRPEYSGSSGNWSPEIYYNVTGVTYFLIDSDDAFIENDIGDFILTQ